MPSLDITAGSRTLPTLLLLRPWCLREVGSPEWKAFAKVFFQISQNVIMGQELRIYSG